MGNSYQKFQYDSCPLFRLNHTIGIDASSSTKDYPHWNPERMVLYFLQGSGNIIINSKTYRIHAGDVICTAPTEMYHCTIDPNMYHERIVLHVNQQFFADFPCDTSVLEESRSHHIPANLVTSSGLGDKFTELLKLAQQTGPANNILSVCKVAELLVLLQEIPTHIPAVTDNARIDRVLAYLNENYTKNITVESIAEQFHITSSHLAHLFKAHAGIPLWNYVILQRLHLANGCMQQGLSAEEACYRAGFDNYANFYRLYKKYMGFAPSRYKKQIQ